MKQILRKILTRFCNWCETYSLGANFSDTRMGSFLYRNALDLELRLQK